MADVIRMLDRFDGERQVATRPPELSLERGA
ncbi:hypothetical protein L1277_000904 [Okibacterium sp. HSC-33S16]|nr:hypothetical protein [Okibacterium sp. HSC-33S16]